MISAFTWSHDIDDITNSGLSVGNNGRGSYPYQQLTLQKGNSDWDIAKRSVTGFVYSLPYGRGKTFGSNLNWAADALLGGWQIGGIATFDGLIGPAQEALKTPLYLQFRGHQRSRLWTKCALLP